MKTITTALAVGMLVAGCEGSWRSTPLPADTSTRSVEAPLECAGLPGTDAELAATPRLDAEAEWLAIAVDGTFAASRDTYERVRSDLAAIRERLPVAERVRASTRVNRINFLVDEPTHAAMIAGTYDAWDCLHARYGWELTSNESSGFGVPPTYVVSGALAGRLDHAAITALYNGLPGVANASFGSPTDGSGLCVTRDASDSLHYVFVEGSGDCESGCLQRAYTHVTTAPDGLIELAGETSPRDTTLPDWVAQYADRASGRCL